MDPRHRARAAHAYASSSSRHEEAPGTSRHRRHSGSHDGQYVHPTPSSANSRARDLHSPMCSEESPSLYPYEGAPPRSQYFSPTDLADSDTDTSSMPLSARGHSRQGSESFGGDVVRRASGARAEQPDAEEEEEEEEDQEEEDQEDDQELHRHRERSPPFLYREPRLSSSSSASRGSMYRGLHTPGSGGGGGGGGGFHGSAERELARSRERKHHASSSFLKSAHRGRQHTSGGNDAPSIRLKEVMRMRKMQEEAHLRMLDAQEEEAVSRRTYQRLAEAFAALKRASYYAMAMKEATGFMWRNKMMESLRYWGVLAEDTR